VAKFSEPIVLELASLSREQIGPFLLLGLDKDADKEAIEAHWADRLKWARKGQIRVPLEDVNWAREALGDPERRARLDAASLNLDTRDGLLSQLGNHYGANGGKVSCAWQPLDREKNLADYAPPAEVPEVDVIRAGLAVPELPETAPAVLPLLERLVQAPLDPWTLDLPAQDQAS
jgi:hypothetical protein